MKNYFLSVVLCVLCVFTGTAHQSSANEHSIPYSLPSLYNPNPVAGRLYLQPIGTNEDRVVSGTQIELGLGSSVDYNIYFTEKPGDANNRLTVNSNIFTLKLSRDFSMGTLPVEIGGIARSHQDKRETLLANMIKNYHEFMSFGNIPPEGRFYGTIGDDGARVIGDSGEFFLTTFQIYAKMQLLQEGGVSSPEPNWSVKLSFRVPASDYAFDTNGISVSTGVSKTVFPQFMLAGALGVIYQDLSQDDFHTTSIRVEKWAYDAFLGCIWDMGKEGGWYFSSGLRISSERISYIKNSTSAEISYCTHWRLSYRKKMPSGQYWEFFMNCNEDLPGLGHGLEPDFRLQLGVAVNWGRAS